MDHLLFYAVLAFACIDLSVVIMAALDLIGHVLDRFIEWE